MDAHRLDWSKIEELLLTKYLDSSSAIATYRKHRQVFAMLRELAPDPARINDRTILDFKARLASRRAATINSLLRTLRTQLRTLKREEIITRNPFDNHRWMERKDPKTKAEYLGNTSHLTVREMLALLRQADTEWEFADCKSRWRAQRLRALVYALLYTGLRKQEALGLKREDVDIDRNLIWIQDNEFRRLKTESSAQPIPICEQAQDVLRDWRSANAGVCFFPRIRDPNQPWMGGDCRYRPLCQLAKLGNRAGIQKKVTFLKCRHSFATLLHYLGFTAEQIARLMRHSNTQTQTSYIQTDLEQLNEMRSRFRIVG